MMRTLLFAPADHARRVARLRELPADVSVLDLEDAVAESAKAGARSAAADAVATGRGLPRVAVRVNGIRTRHFAADVEATVRPGLELLVVPKVEEPDDLHAVDALLAPLEAERGLATPVGVIALLETARGIANAERIAVEVPERFERFVFGSADYTTDVGVEPSPGEPELLYARSRVVNAAALAGRGAAIDGPFLGIGHQEELRADCERSRRLGFGGRVTIHPSQIEIVNAAYAILDPSAVARLTETVESYERAAEQGATSIRVGDTFVDPPIYAHARDALARHRDALASATRSPRCTQGPRSR
jgi:citrate lyase subunit beta / citryl-CoA lyase